ncbi:MAG: hypothetical protein DSM106950_32385 [Stigonema ocellatum SAG 48.90 = DSM 106950]|nr:hypothetical protein [Stigonema ocellatum SAG 48.90 = DSM 106950]
MDIKRFISCLFEARDYYQNTLDHALSQLEHINALLEGLGSEHPLNTTSNLPPDIDAHPLSESAEELSKSQTNGALSNLDATTDLKELNQSLKEAALELKQVQETSAPASQEERAATTLSQTSPVGDVESIAASTPSKVLDATEKESINGYPSQNSLVESNPTQFENHKPTQKPSKASEPNKLKGSPNSRNKRLPQRPRPMNIPFVPNLVGMKLGDAILCVLQENPETVSHTDYIVRAVFGEIEGNILRTAKDRVTKELSRGYKLGRWYRLSDTPGYYTVSKQLTESR